MYEGMGFPSADIADADRHRVSYREENLYILVVAKEKELFISSVEQDIDPLTGSVFDTLSRLVTLSWNGTSLKKVVEQLKRSSRVKNDLPGILSTIL